MYTITDVGTVKGYEVFARFEGVDGLAPGDDVRMSSIEIGTVVDQSFDGESYLAVPRFSVDPSLKLPEDATVAVVSEGLLGGKYLSLTPGAAEEIIQPGGEISYTQSSVNFEQLLGKFIFSQDEKIMSFGRCEFADPSELPRNE